MKWHKCIINKSCYRKFCIRMHEHIIIYSQGVIFSITTHAARQLLCSVSDDRSVHLWKVNSDLTDLDLSDWTISNWVRATFDLIHILYGHTARVWQAVLLSNGLVSVGEVSVCMCRVQHKPTFTHTHTHTHTHTRTHILCDGCYIIYLFIFGYLYRTPVVYTGTMKVKYRNGLKVTRSVFSRLFV